MFSPESTIDVANVNLVFTHVNTKFTMIFMLVRKKRGNKIKGMTKKDLHAESKGQAYIEAGDEGVYVRDRYLALGYTLTDFARALGVSRMALYKLFRGEYALTRELVAKLNDIDPDRQLVPLWRIESKTAASKTKTAARKK